MIITNTRRKTERRKKKKKKKYLLVFFSYLQVIRKIIVKIDPKMYLFQMMLLMKDEPIVMALVYEENSLNYK
jgi:hypothetical protein